MDLAHPETMSDPTNHMLHVVRLTHSKRTFDGSFLRQYSCFWASTGWNQGGFLGDFEILVTTIILRDLSF